MSTPWRFKTRRAPFPTGRSPLFVESTRIGADLGSSVHLIPARPSRCRRGWRSRIVENDVDSCRVRSRPSRAFRAYDTRRVTTKFGRRAVARAELQSFCSRRRRCWSVWRQSNRLSRWVVAFSNTRRRGVRVQCVRDIRQLPYFKKSGCARSSSKKERHWRWTRDGCRSSSSGLSWHGLQRPRRTQQSYKTNIGAPRVTCAYILAGAHHLVTVHQ